MAAKKKETGLGRAGFFDDPPSTQQPAPQPPESEQPKRPAKRTTIILDNDTLDLIDALKSHYRREGITATQSDLCAWGIKLLAEHNGIKT